MKRILALLLLVVSFACTMPNFASAQGTPSEGKDYYLGFLYPSFNRVIPAFSAGFFRVYAIISSFQDNTAYVSYFNENGTEENAIPYKIQARKGVSVPLNVAKMRMTDPGDGLKEYKAVHITAKKPINVQFFSSGGSSCGMYLCLPTNGLGTKYVIHSYYDNPEGNLAMLGGRGPSELDVACGYFMVIAAYNGTTVQIIPTSTTQGGKHTGVTNGPGSTGTPMPYTVSLNRGQCYMVKSHCGSSENDISGSIIESDKPIAVISGHENNGIGSVSGRSLEGRDYMVEQMMPVDYWDNTGYISVPLVDSDPYNGDGTGENLRIYTYDDAGSTVEMEKLGIAGTVNMSVSRYFYRETFDVEVPTNFYSTNGKKFSVSQIDLANHSSKQPYPRPSMMTLIPRSRWRNAYLWTVPSNVDERLQAYYVNIIGPKDNSFDSIYISKNGQKDQPIRSAGMAQSGQYLTIPGHPDLKCIRYKVTPGSYYARARFPFMIYHYGNRAIDSDGDLGDFDNDDNFFAYALPLGAVLGTGDSADMVIKVDTLCTGWRICATDRHVNGGIKSAIIADDPYGDIFPYDETKRGPYQYYNTSFTPDLDPNNTREIIFDGLDTTECFFVTIDNIGKDGYAPVFITDNNGNGKMVELYYKKAAVAYQPSPDIMTNFGIQYILDTKDSTFMFINQPTSQKPYIIEEVDLIKKSPAFKIISTDPTPLPFTLSPGDTFRIKVQFTYNDTGYFMDSLKMKTDCFTTYWPIEGTVGTGIIVAADHDFGNVVVGSTACTDTVSLKNIGNMPFTLTDKWVLGDNVDFSFDPTRIRRGNRDYPLPQVIQPGETVLLYVCFKPSSEGADSTILQHDADIREPYKKTIKDFSRLRGNGIKPGVNWDLPQDSLVVICEEETIHRRYLINTSTAQITVNQVYIDGPDAAEFRIVGTQNALPLAIDTGAQVWVDIAFKADLSKPYSLVRTANLKAKNTFDTAEIDLCLLKGRVLHAEIALNPTTIIDMGNIPLSTPTQGGFTLTNPGDAPLIITGVIMPNPEIVSITPPLSLPDTIMPGELIPYNFEINSDKYTDTTVPLIFISNGNPCTPPDTVLIHYVVSNRNVLATGFNAPNTYVDCRDSRNDTRLWNEGTTNINLRSVEIVNDATDDDADQFELVSGGSIFTYTPPKVIAAISGSETVPVLFKPTRTGQLSAKIKFTYDSAGITVYTLLPLISGTGVKLNNTFSAQNPAGVNVNYVQKTGEIFELPIRITDVIEQPAGVYGVRFTLTYKRDVLDFREVTDGENGLAPVDATPTATYNGNETESIVIETRSGQQLLNGMIVANARFQVMVSKDSTTDFVITNGEFLDNNGNTLCYFDKQYLPGQFAAEYQCGDETISNVMKGVTPTRIVQVTPNPSNTSGNVKVIYDVNATELPVTIELYNLLGSKIRTIQTQEVVRQGSHKASFDTKGIPAGTYTLRVTSPVSSQSETFVIEK
jgi:hypothetical protein